MFFFFVNFTHILFKKCCENANGNLFSENIKQLFGNCQHIHVTNTINIININCIDCKAKLLLDVQRSDITMTSLHQQ